MSDRSEQRWVEVADGRVLADSVRVADTFWKRLVGLQFARSMPSGEVLCLLNCRSIHTAWMRFTIDVFFLDEANRVVEVHRGVRPWRVVRPQAQQAKHVVEARSLESSETIVAGLQTRFDWTRNEDHA